MNVAQLSINDIDQIVVLTKQVNKKLSDEVLKARLTAGFGSANYVCFGLFDEGVLLGVCSGWLTTRLYSGKQLELDNVVVSEEKQSKGYGKFFLEQIESWAVAAACETVELNTYVANARSHKFYFTRGYQIIGYHFQKSLKARTDGAPL